MGMVRPRGPRSDHGLTTVQFTFDLADPWWPDAERTDIAGKIRQAADDNGLTIDTAFVGLAHYVPAGLLDPDPAARRLAVRWWRRDRPYMRPWRPR